MFLLSLGLKGKKIFVGIMEKDNDSSLARQRDKMEAGLEDYERELFQGVEEWMESLRAKLREEKLKLKRERKEFEEEKEKMGALVGKIDEIVELNVGGTRFATTRSLLCQYQGTVLTKFLFVFFFNLK